MKAILFLALGLLSQVALATHPVVVLETTEGEIQIELYEDRAPVTVANFLQYVDEGFYAGTIFHRVIDKFVIQGGSVKEDLIELPTHGPILNEADNGLSNDLGTIAMARESDPHSATSGFYINVIDNPRLNFREATQAGFGYAVFGKVIKGLEVVLKIKTAETTTVGDFEDVPKKPITVKKITRL